jgi:membrane associated rhomboid family serine protease
MAVCYRHPSRETGVSCSNCGNPICPDCMTPTPVGMRCPECSKQSTPVRTMRNIYSDPTATYVLIAINVLLFVGGWISRSDSVYEDLALIGHGITFQGNVIGVAEGEYWRLITGGFLHSQEFFLHIVFNMYALYFIGQMLEPVLGHVRFVALYFASLLAGSFGALLLTPDNYTVGASGAVFGLMGAAFVFQQLRGVDPMQGGIGPVILLNLAITFFPGLNISIGGHVGGLIGGGLAALAIERLGRRRRPQPLQVLACVAVGALSVAGSIAVAA